MTTAAERQIEGEDREQPEEQLVAAELGGGADPDGADHEHDLGQDQIGEAELLPEDGAPASTAGLFLSDAGALGDFRRSVHLGPPFVSASWRR